MPPTDAPTPDRRRAAVEAVRQLGPLVPLTLFLVAVSEALRVPREALGGSPALAGGVLVHAIGLAASSLVGPLLYQVGFVLVEAAPWSRRGTRVVVHAALAAAFTLHVHGVLVSYPAFAGYPPFIALLAALLLFLAWAGASLPRGERPPPSLRRRVHDLALITGALGGAVVLYALNGELYRGTYPSLHHSALLVSGTLLFVGLVRLIAAGGLVPGRRAAASLALAAALALLATASSTGLVTRGRAEVIAHTQLGAALLLGGAEVEPTCDEPVAADPDAVERFRRHSGLPALPDRFALADHHVLLIAVEATRFDRTSLAAPELGTTPQLRAFAEDGAFWFSRAHAPSSGTLQSMASLLAMSYPSMLALESWQMTWVGELREEEVTVPEILAGAGRRTFWIGHNFHEGFDRVIHGLDQGFQEVELLAERSDRDAMDLDSRIVDRAIARLQELAGRPGRFFGLVFLSSPHAPYVARSSGSPGDEHARYLEEIRYADGELGRLLGEVTRLGLLEDTIVIVLSDHGEEFREHGGVRHKSTLYSEVTHVPLVVRIPGVPGRRLDALTSTMYLFPWLLLHGEPDQRAAAERRLSREIGPVLAATDHAVESELLGTTRMLASLVHPGRRVIYDFLSGLHETYDLAADPGEQRNLSPTGSAEAERLHGLMDRYRRLRCSLRRYTLRPDRSAVRFVRQ